MAVQIPCLPTPRPRRTREVLGGLSRFGRHLLECSDLPVVAGRFPVLNTGPFRGLSENDPGFCAGRCASEAWWRCPREEGGLF